MRVPRRLFRDQAGPEERAQYIKLLEAGYEAVRVTSSVECKDGPRRASVLMAPAIDHSIKLGNHLWLMLVNARDEHEDLLCSEGG